jgi:hypothetical protein
VALSEVIIIKVDLFLVPKVDAEKKSKKQVKKERIKAAEEARRGKAYCR